MTHLEELLKKPQQNLRKKAKDQGWLLSRSLVNKTIKMQKNVIQQEHYQVPLLTELHFRTTQHFLKITVTLFLPPKHTAAEERAKAEREWIAMVKEYAEEVAAIQNCQGIFISFEKKSDQQMKHLAEWGYPFLQEVVEKELVFDKECFSFLGEHEVPALFKRFFPGINQSLMASPSAVAHLQRCFSFYLALLQAFEQEKQTDATFDYEDIGDPQSHTVWWHLVKKGVTLNLSLDGSEKGVILSLVEKNQKHTNHYGTPDEMLCFIREYLVKVEKETKLRNLFNPPKHHFQELFRTEFKLRYLNMRGIEGSNLEEKVYHHLRSIYSPNEIEERSLLERKNTEFPLTKEAINKTEEEVFVFRLFDVYFCGWINRDSGETQVMVEHQRDSAMETYLNTWFSRQKLVKISELDSIFNKIPY